MHARTSALGKWLLASARNEPTKDPASWDRAVGRKDERGRLLSQGLPYIDGFCVVPSRWRVLNPAHIRPSKQSRKDTMEDLVTIDAFEPETVKAVEAAREEVRSTFLQMRDFW